MNRHHRHSSPIRRGGDGTYSLNIGRRNVRSELHGVKDGANPPPALRGHSTTTPTINKNSNSTSSSANHTQTSSFKDKLLYENKNRQFDWGGGLPGRNNAAPHPNSKFGANHGTIPPRSGVPRSMSTGRATRPQHNSLGSANGNRVGDMAKGARNPASIGKTTKTESWSPFRSNSNGRGERFQVPPSRGMFRSQSTGRQRLLPSQNKSAGVGALALKTTRQGVSGIPLSPRSSSAQRQRGGLVENKARLLSGTAQHNPSNRNSSSDTSPSRPPRTQSSQQHRPLFSPGRTDAGAQFSSSSLIDAETSDSSSASEQARGQLQGLGLGLGLGLGHHQGLNDNHDQNDANSKNDSTSSIGATPNDDDAMRFSIIDANSRGRIRGGRTSTPSKRPIIPGVGRRVSRSPGRRHSDNANPPLQDNLDDAASANIDYQCGTIKLNDPHSSRRHQTANQRQAQHGYGHGQPASINHNALGMGQDESTPTTGQHELPKPVLRAPTIDLTSRYTKLNATHNTEYPISRHRMMESPRDSSAKQPFGGKIKAVTRMDVQSNPTKLFAHGITSDTTTTDSVTTDSWDRQSRHDGSDLQHEQAQRPPLHGQRQQRPGGKQQHLSQAQEQQQQQQLPQNEGLRDVMSDLSLGTADHTNKKAQGGKLPPSPRRNQKATKNANHNGVDGQRRPQNDPTTMATTNPNVGAIGDADANSTMNPNPNDKVITRISTRIPEVLPKPMSKKFNNDPIMKARLLEANMAARRANGNNQNANRSGSRNRSSSQDGNHTEATQMQMNASGNSDVSHIATSQNNSTFNSTVNSSVHASRATPRHSNASPSKIRRSSGTETKPAPGIGSRSANGDKYSNAPDHDSGTLETLEVDAKMKATQIVFDNEDELMIPRRVVIDDKAGNQSGAGQARRPSPAAGSATSPGTSNPGASKSARQSRPAPILFQDGHFLKTSQSKSKDRAPLVPDHNIVNPSYRRSNATGAHTTKAGPGSGASVASGSSRGPSSVSSSQRGQRAYVDAVEGKLEAIRSRQNAVSTPEQLSTQWKQLLESAENRQRLANAKDGSSTSGGKKSKVARLFSAIRGGNKTNYNNTNTNNAKAGQDASSLSDNSRSTRSSLRSRSRSRSRPKSRSKDRSVTPGKSRKGRMTISVSSGSDGSNSDSATSSSNGKRGSKSPSPKNSASNSSSNGSKPKSTLGKWMQRRKESGNGTNDGNGASGNERESKKAMSGLSRLPEDDELSQPYKSLRVGSGLGRKSAGGGRSSSISGNRNILYSHSMSGSMDIDHSASIMSMGSSRGDDESGKSDSNQSYAVMGKFTTFDSAMNKKHEYDGQNNTNVEFGVIEIGTDIPEGEEVLERSNMNMNVGLGMSDYGNGDDNGDGELAEQPLYETRKIPLNKAALAKELQNIRGHSLLEERQEHSDYRGDHAGMDRYNADSNTDTNSVNNGRQPPPGVRSITPGRVGRVGERIYHHQQRNHKYQQHNRQQQQHDQHQQQDQQQQDQQHDQQQDQHQKQQHRLGRARRPKAYGRSQVDSAVLEIFSYNSDLECEMERYQHPKDDSDLHAVSLTPSFASHLNRARPTGEMQRLRQQQSQRMTMAATPLRPPTATSTASTPTPRTTAPRSNSATRRRAYIV